MKITREKAWKLLTEHTQSQNLRRHCYSVEAVMRALARKLSTNNKQLTTDIERWGIVGLLHDGDYEFTKEKPEEHAKLMANWVRELGETDEELLTGIESHGWFHQGLAAQAGKEPKTKMQWALFCCDELTGLIVAVTLVRPTKKLADVAVQNVLDKWDSKSFAAGVKREDIEKCEERLGIPLPEFIEIALKAMQGISVDLGL